jgi:hypothetical protein
VESLKGASPIRERCRMSGMELYGVAGVGFTGVALVALGAFLVFRGILARMEITAALLEENATTPSGGGPGAGAPAGDHPSFDPGIPTQPIRNAATARTRIDEIKFRTLADGGYQSLPVEGDRRQWFLNGLVIRSALGIAVMGYGVSNIAIALGASLILIGGTSLAVGIPLILKAVD